MCRKYPHVYLTLAWHFNDLVHHNKFLAWQELEEMRIQAGIEKILYGSDFPASPNMKEVIHFLKYEKVPVVLRLMGFPEWTYEMRAKVLGLNAAKVLGLKNPTIEKLEKRFSKKVQELTMAWDADAMRQAQTIPAFVRSSAIKSIEEYAKTHGYKTITTEVMQKARNRQ